MQAVSNRDSLREKINRLERAMLSIVQVDCPVRHYFAPGVYAREITIPGGVTLVGAIHKTENIAVLSKGRLVLATEAGPVEISAPHTLTVKPGDKNSATALEDCVWTNFLSNPSNERDIDKLVEIFTESKNSELIGGADNKQLAGNKSAESIEA